MFCTCLPARTDRPVNFAIHSGHDGETGDRAGNIDLSLRRPRAHRGENPDILAALTALEAQGLIVRVEQNLLPPDTPSEAYEQLAQLAVRFWKCCNACTWLSASLHSVLSKLTS